MTLQKIQELLNMFTLGDVGFFALLLYFLFIGFRHYIKKGIENKFSQDLERLKADLENVKLYNSHELGVLSNRRINWHEKEQEVLSESWKKAMKAKLALDTSMVTIRMGIGFDENNDEQFKYFLTSKCHNFSQEEKSKLQKAKAEGDNVDRVFIELYNKRDIENASEALSEFQIYFNENRIFLRPHIGEKFSKISKYILEAFLPHMQNINPKDAKVINLELFNMHKKKINPLIEEVENVIQKELFPDSKDKP